MYGSNADPDVAVQPPAVARQPAQANGLGTPAKLPPKSLATGKRVDGVSASAPPATAAVAALSPQLQQQAQYMQRQPQPPLQRPQQQQRPEEQPVKSLRFSNPLVTRYVLLIKQNISREVVRCIAICCNFYNY